MSRLPFTTDDVREQCEMFGDAPLAHPLPVRDLLKMCDRIDELEIEIRTKRVQIHKMRIERDEARNRHDTLFDRLEVMARQRDAARARIDAVREYADRLVPGHMQTSLYVALEPEQ